MHLIFVGRIHCYHKRHNSKIPHSRARPILPRCQLWCTAISAWWSMSLFSSFYHTSCVPINCTRALTRFPSLVSLSPFALSRVDLSKFKIIPTYSLAYICLIPLVSAATWLGIRTRFNMLDRTASCPSVMFIVNHYLLEWLFPIIICIIFIWTTKEFYLIWNRITKRYRDERSLQRWVNRQNISIIVSVNFRERTVNEGLMAWTLNVCVSLVYIYREATRFRINLPVWWFGWYSGPLVAAISTILKRSHSLLLFCFNKFLKFNVRVSRVKNVGREVAQFGRLNFFFW